VSRASLQHKLNLPSLSCRLPRPLQIPLDNSHDGEACPAHLDEDPAYSGKLLQIIKSQIQKFCEMPPMRDRVSCVDAYCLDVLCSCTGSRKELDDLSCTALEQVHCVEKLGCLAV
jgi:hypothetical protein